MTISVLFRRGNCVSSQFELYLGMVIFSESQLRPLRNSLWCKRILLWKTNTIITAYTAIYTAIRSESIRTYLPRAQMTSIFEGQTLKTRPNFQAKRWFYLGSAYRDEYSAWQVCIRNPPIEDQTVAQWIGGFQTIWIPRKYPFKFTWEIYGPKKQGSGTFRIF